MEDVHYINIKFEHNKWLDLFNEYNQSDIQINNTTQIIFKYTQYLMAIDEARSGMPTGKHLPPLECWAELISKSNFGYEFKNNLATARDDLFYDQFFTT